MSQGGVIHAKKTRSCLCPENRRQPPKRSEIHGPKTHKGKANGRTKRQKSMRRNLAGRCPGQDTSDPSQSCPDSSRTFGGIPFPLSRICKTTAESAIESLTFAIALLNACEHS